MSAAEGGASCPTHGSEALAAPASSAAPTKDSLLVEPPTSHAPLSPARPATASGERDPQMHLRDLQPSSREPGRRSSRADGTRDRVPPGVQSAAMAASYKLVWFVPASHLSSTRDAVFVAGAGWIGDYSRCSWSTLGEGTFRGGEGTKPTVGEAGRDERVAEYRVETVVPAEKLEQSSPPSGARTRMRSRPSTSTSASRHELGPRVTRRQVRRRAPTRPGSGRTAVPAGIGPAAYAFVLEAEDGTVLEARGESIGIATNNFAEYSALVAGLERAAEGGRLGLEVLSDSELMVKQMRGEYRVEQGPADPVPRGFARGAGVGRVSYEHVRREHNELADRLVNEALDAAP